MKLSSSASANAPRSEVPPRRRLTRKFKRADAVLPGSALALSLEGRCVLHRGALLAVGERELERARKAVAAQEYARQCCESAAPAARTGDEACANFERAVRGEFSRKTKKAAEQVVLVLKEEAAANGGALSLATACQMLRTLDATVCTGSRPSARTTVPTSGRATSASPPTSRSWRAARRAARSSSR